MTWSRFVNLAGPLAALALAAMPLTAPLAGDFDGSHTFKAVITGFQETPAIVTAARGTLRLAIAPDGASMDYELTYMDLEADATVAHIHVGQRGVAGGVAAFLCGGGGKPACPARTGTVTGTITAADVLDLPAQGIAAGQLDRFLVAIRGGVTYANVHSILHPAGEIRGQIEVRHGDAEREAAE